MKRLYSARDPIEAQSLRLFLENYGISASLDGESNSFENGFYFSDLSRPGVYVDEADWADAENLLNEYHAAIENRLDGGDWRCERCEESAPWQFDECWKCASPKTQSTHPVSRHGSDRASIWLK